MKVWVDADACPTVIREVLYRAARRTQIPLILVANHVMSVPASPHITFLKVGSGFDVADQRISDALEAGDLVITSDIPLASEVIDKGGHALSPRGEMFSADTIRSLLNMRDFMDVMRGSGVHTGGPAPLNQNDRKAFADNLDRFLTRYGRST